MLQFATFRLAGYLFGIEVVKVQEVLRYQRMTAVPLAPPEIAGLINLRGQIVTALDLRSRLRLPERPDDRLPMNVVVRTPEGSLSLLVDEIGDVIEVSESAFERPPATLTGPARQLVRGAYKLENRLMLVLDIEATVGVPAAA
jgi:purine-binding chemotaxis protein CheW